MECRHFRDQFDSSIGQNSCNSNLNAVEVAEILAHLLAIYIYFFMSDLKLEGENHPLQHQWGFINLNILVSWTAPRRVSPSIGNTFLKPLKGTESQGYYTYEINLTQRFFPTMQLLQSTLRLELIGSQS